MKSIPKTELYLAIDTDGNLIRIFNDELEMIAFCQDTVTLSLSPKARPYQRQARIHPNPELVKERWNRPMPKSIYLTMDETGNKGESQKKNRVFIVGCCVVNNKPMFDKASADRYEGKEIKFYNNMGHTPEEHDQLRKAILKDAVPYVSRIYYIEAKKPDIQWTTEEKKRIQVDMVRTLAEYVMKDIERDSFDFEVDRIEEIPDDDIKGAISSVVPFGKRAQIRVEESKDSLSLMTNDMFMGAIGYDRNQQNYEYTNVLAQDNLLPKRIPYYVKSENTRGNPPPCAEQRATCTPGRSERCRRFAGERHVTDSLVVQSSGRNKYFSSSKRGRNNVSQGGKQISGRRRR